MRRMTAHREFLCEELQRGAEMREAAPPVRDVQYELEDQNRQMMAEFRRMQDNITHLHNEMEVSREYASQVKGEKDELAD